MAKIRLTMAQALVRYLAAQQVPVPDGTVPLFAGVFAIFGHGNVAGLGEALEPIRKQLPVWRAHNEQAMAHAAIAFAKASLQASTMSSLSASVASDWASQRRSERRSTARVIGSAGMVT